MQQSIVTTMRFGFWLYRKVPPVTPARNPAFTTNSRCTGDDNRKDQADLGGVVSDLYRLVQSETRKTCGSYSTYLFDRVWTKF